MLDDAILMLKLNVEASLAEACMDNGDKELTATNYQQSLKLNPANSNAAAKLKKLNSQ